MRQPACTSAQPPSGDAGKGIHGRSPAVSGASASAGVRLMILDDCALHREALATMLEMNGVTDVRAAWDIPSLIGVLEDIEPEVILLNMSTRGIQLILRAVKSLSPQAPVIAVAVSEDDENGIIACAEAGVAGYHLRIDSFSDLLALMGAVVAGKVWWPPQISATLLCHLSALASQRRPAVQDSVLTTREAQILSLLELGRSNQDIAGELAITVHTVKNHVHNLLKKLGVGTRAEAAALSHAFRVDQGAYRRARPRSIQN